MCDDRLNRMSVSHLLWVYRDEFEQLVVFNQEAGKGCAEAVLSYREI